LALDSFKIIEERFSEISFYKKIKYIFLLTSRKLIPFLDGSAVLTKRRISSHGLHSFPGWIHRFVLPSECPIIMSCAMRACPLRLIDGWIKREACMAVPLKIPAFLDLSHVTN